VNRPKDEAEFTSGNSCLTQQLCDALAAAGRKAVLVISSSTQAELENPYGKSKLAAEEAVLDYHRRTGAPVYIYRFPNVFGKWSRPHYNTVVATFCHQLSRGLPVQISNPANVIRFVYIDDIVKAFLNLAAAKSHDAAKTRHEVAPVLTITLGELHDRLLSFRETVQRGMIPDLADTLTRYLYSTYLSFQPIDALGAPAEMKTDQRGWLFELLKSPHAGQIFISQTKPGVTRGNHYHDSKVEKFCVIQGEAVIRLRPMLGGEITEYAVSGQNITTVNIPPGCSHSIENTGSADVLTVFWSNEIFDPARPDTYAEPVKA